MAQLAQSFLFLITDERGKSSVGNVALRFTLAGAVIQELWRLGRVDFAPPASKNRAGTIAMVSLDSTGDAVLDQAMSRIAGRKRPGAADMVRRLSNPVYRALGKPATPEAGQQLRLELFQALDGTIPAGPFLGDLANLASLAGCLTKLYPDLPPDALQARALEIAEPSWALRAALDARMAQRNQQYWAVGGLIGTMMAGSRKVPLVR